MTTQKFDAIVIGTGQAGKPLALALANEGWKVAVIEKRFVGGSCINYGCTPTKTMISSARISYLVSRSKEFGIHSGKVKVDIDKIVNRKEKIVRAFRESGKRSLEKNKNIKLIFGTASFEDRKKIIVRTNKKIFHLIADYIFVNSGTSSFIPSLKGLENVDFLTSETLMQLREIPKHLIILGGSYIGLEFAQMYRRFGSRVTVIERGPGIIFHEDDDIISEMENILTDDGIKIYKSADVSEIKKGKNKFIRIQFNTGNKNINITGSQILIATGLKPETEDLCLENAGIKKDKRNYIIVNDKLETNVKGVYALGDVKGGPAFTHISYDDFRIVFGNIIRKENRSTRNRLVPYTVFTDPQLGRIGINEKEAKEQNIKYKIGKLPMENVARAAETGEKRGFMKAIVNPDTKQILGASIIGIEAGEIISMIEIAMMGKIPYTKLRDGIFSHPTLSEALNNLFRKVG